MSQPVRKKGPPRQQNKLSHWLESPFYPVVARLYVSSCPLQVVEETHLVLKEYGFRFVRRGPIYVKGKGELLTYFMKGRDKQGSFVNGSSVTLPHQVVDSS